MKWTRFKQEFDPGGPLHRLLQKGDQLIKDPGTPVRPPQQDIWVSQMHDPLIDNCFRIYSNPLALRKVMYDGPDAKKRQSCYHPWHFYENVPEQYLDPVYFNPKLLASIYKKRNPKLVHSRSKNGGAFPLGGDKPHPYEVFAGGWAHFYDMEVRHAETDHALYFLWDAFQKNVTIYIYQTTPNSKWNVYVRVNPPSVSQDPPRPKSPPPYC